MKNLKDKEVNLLRVPQLVNGEPGLKPNLDLESPVDARLLYCSASAMCE